MTGANLAAGAISLGSALLFTPLIRRVCLALHLYDPPGPLKIHLLPTPRLGGISLAIALTLAICFANYSPNRLVWTFFLALAPIWFTGLLDDLRRLSPGIRLVAQIAAATILWREGLRLPLTGNGVFSFLATCFVVMLFVNAMNFLDGADGLAAGTVAIIAAGYAILPGGTLSGTGSIVAWALLGACLGFLAYNFPRAKSFMGDSGSTLLGFSVAYLALDFWHGSPVTNSHLLLPILIAAVPLLDAVLAVARRLYNFRSPFFGDRRHLYDILQARGWRPRRVALACYAITALMAIAGLLTMRVRFPEQVLITAVCFGGLLAAALRLGILNSGETVPRRRKGKLGGLDGRLLSNTKRNSWGTE